MSSFKDSLPPSVYNLLSRYMDRVRAACQDATFNFSQIDIINDRMQGCVTYQIITNGCGYNDCIHLVYSPSSDTAVWFPVWGG